MPVPGLGRQFLEHRQLGFEPQLLAFVFSVLGDLVGVGVDDHHPARAVDDDRVPAAQFRRDVAQPHDRRDSHRAGDDRGVARASADIGREAAHVHLVQRGSLAGQQIVRDDHDVLRELRQV
jgi:hypothetical protein